MHTLAKRIISGSLAVLYLSINNAVPFAVAAQESAPSTMNENVQQTELGRSASNARKIKSIENDIDGLLSLESFSQSQTSARTRLPLTVQEPEQLDFKANEDIVLTVNNPDHEAFETKVVDFDGQEVAAEVRQVDSGLTSEIVVIADNQFKPGRYTIEVTDQEQKTTKQIFTWGVLAINTDRSIYTPAQKANISMAVLNEHGDMVCDADVTLSITKPDGQVDRLTSKEKTIITNDVCSKKEFTVKPDYETSYTLGDAGVYKLFLMAVTNSGTYSIEDSILVKNQVDFDVKRIGSTRIYPPLHYPVNLEITANRDFNGVVTETVPDSFTITPSDEANSYDKMNTLYFDKKRDPAHVLGATTGNLVMPFDGTYTITQGFGSELTEPNLRNFYSHYGLGGHDGIDFALPIGTPLYAVDDGAVLLAGDGDYGTTIVMQHSWGRTYYGHLSKTVATANKDSMIKKGTLIGYSGNTGESTGPHLHFGMKPDKPDTGNGYIGKVDPMAYLPITGANQASTFGLGNLNAVLSASDAATETLPTKDEPIIESVEASEITEAKSVEKPGNEAKEYTVSDAQIQKEVQLSESPVIEKVKIIKWHVTLKKGEKTTLSYTYLAPQESPQFYVTGPLKFFDGTQRVIFEEARKWQIAADALGDDWYDKAWEYRKEITLEPDTWCNDSTGVTCNTSWTARRKITINNSASGTSLTDFPILVVLNSSRIDYAKTQGSGQDLRFVSSADPNTAIPHEIELWNESGSSYVWVQVDLTASSTTDYIWMYYGNASASDPATELGNSTHATGVWDSSYKLIHHLAESASPYQDATSNNLDGSEATTPPTANSSGKIAGAQDFDGTNDKYSTANSPGLPTGDFTYNVWVRADNTTLRTILSAANGSNENEVSMIIDGSVDGYTNGGYENSSAGLSTATWYNIAYQRSGSTLTFYVNGAASGATGSDATALGFGTCPLVVGTKPEPNCTAYQFYMDGRIDEVRVSTIARSVDWIEAEYLTMNDSMNSFGSEQTSTATLTDFPVAISLSSDTNLSSLAQGDGDDILFTSDNGRTKLSHEIESYSAGTLVAWVKVPTLNLFQDTKIYMYYGNTGTSSQQDATNVWDTNYRGVWHLKETPSSAPQDSTSQNNDGTYNGTWASGAQQTGKLNGNLKFSPASTNGISVNGIADDIATGNLTYSFWFNPTSTWTSAASNDAYLFSLTGATSENDARVYLDQVDGTLGFTIFDTCTPTAITANTSQTSWTGGTWYHVVTVFSSTAGMSVYINGALAGTDSNTARCTTPASTTAIIGDYYPIGSDNYDGKIDEMRVSNAVRSADWIETEYRNHNSPSTFHTLGSQETYIYAPLMPEIMRHGKFFDSRGAEQPFAY